jgi:hypothetical protein
MGQILIVPPLCSDALKIVMKAGTQSGQVQNNGSLLFERGLRNISVLWRDYFVMETESRKASECSDKGGDNRTAGDFHCIWGIKRINTERIGRNTGIHDDGDGPAEIENASLCRETSASRLCID